MRAELESPDWMNRAQLAVEDRWRRMKKDNYFLAYKEMAYSRDLPAPDLSVHAGIFAEFVKEERLPCGARVRLVPCLCDAPRTRVLVAAEFSK